MSEPDLKLIPNDEDMTEWFVFDVQCERCGCVYLSNEPSCPTCEAEQEEMLTKD